MSAAGTAAKPILFTSDEADPVTHPWAGIRLKTDESASASLRHIIVEYSAYGVIVYSGGGTGVVEISDSEFRNNSVALLGFSDSDMLVTNTVFHDNQTVLQRGQKGVS